MQAVLFNAALSPAIGLRPILSLLLLGVTERLFPMAQIPDVLGENVPLIVLACLAAVELVGDWIPAVASAMSWLIVPVSGLVQYALPYLLQSEHAAGTIPGTADGSLDPGAMTAGDWGTVLLAGTVPMLMSVLVAVTKSASTMLVDLVPDPVSNVVRSLGEGAAAVVLVLLALVAVPVALVLAVVVVVLAAFAVRRLLALLGRMRARFSSYRAARETAAAEQARARADGRPAPSSWSIVRDAVMGRDPRAESAAFPEAEPPASGR